MGKTRLAQMSETKMATSVLKIDQSTHKVKKNALFSSGQFGSRWYLCARKKPIWAPSSLSEVFPMLPLKQFQCSCDWRWPPLVLSRLCVIGQYRSVHNYSDDYIFKRHTDKRIPRSKQWDEWKEKNLFSLWLDEVSFVSMSRAHAPFVCFDPIPNVIP